MTISLQSTDKYKADLISIFDNLKPETKGHIESLYIRKKRSKYPSVYNELIEQRILSELQGVESSKNNKRKIQDNKNKVQKIKLQI